MAGLINCYAKKQKKVGFLQETAYVTHPIRYSTLRKRDVVRMASEDSGVSEAIIGSVYTALEKQINQMVCNGHTVYWPGIGYLRLGLSARAVQNKENVSTNLVRRVKLTLQPAAELRDALKEAHFEIAYIDDGDNT